MRNAGMSFSASLSVSAEPPKHSSDIAGYGSTSQSYAGMKHGQTQQTLLFPRYLFVHMDLYSGAASQINTVPGVLRLVAFGEFPPQVPSQVIESLRERVDAMNANGGLPRHSFQPGELGACQRWATPGPRGAVRRVR